MVITPFWCNVPVDNVDEMLKHAVPISITSEYGKHILRHPYIPCLEPRCRAIQDAIDTGKLKVGRDGGNTYFATHDHVAYSRRTLKRADIKEWIASKFPNDKPAFLFDEIERKTHSAINADVFRALQADRDASKAELQKMVRLLEEVTNERDTLKACIDKMTAAQATKTYLVNELKRLT